jgi:hypothetical protein
MELGKDERQTIDEMTEEEFEELMALVTEIRRRRSCPA